MTSLAPMRSVSFGTEGPVLLVVMDGVGIGEGDEGDAVALARTPNLEALKRRALYTELAAHGTAVGLPSDGDMGNSEVGHNALGAGRVVDQGAKRVQQAVASGELFEGRVFQRVLERAKAGGCVHLMGLLSDGNVHSHIDHALAIVAKCRELDVARVRLHVLLDGRDVEARSALSYLKTLEAALKGSGDYRIASGGGRMTTTMDRYEADWSIVERGWNAHVHGEAPHTFASAAEAVTSLYASTDEDDQFLPAFVIADESGPVGTIEDGDAVLFFNFRGDRAIEITRAFTETDFTAFDRGARPDVFYAGMMQYDGDLQIPTHFLVDPPVIDGPMSEHLSASGERQFACSETQKFGHVTYFWNGNRSEPFEGETHEEIASDRAPFEERPWMKSAEITDATLRALSAGQHRAFRINYACGDMVGHTGHLDATVIAVEAVDLQVGRLVEAIDALGGALIVTADHGNADQMHQRKDGETTLDASGAPLVRTSHSLNAVPCFIYAPQLSLQLRDITSPGLANVAATYLNLLGYAAPAGFEPSLIEAKA